MKQVIEYKSIAANEISIKDIDQKKGRIIGYFSVFGNQDADCDVVLPGAFKKTLQDNYRRIKHLYQHDPFRPLAGTKDDRLIIKEDNYGLHFDSTISQTSWGRDTIRLYVDGVVDEHSFGFQTVRDNPKSGYRELIELKLFEGSTTTWGANELAQSTDVKGLFSVETISFKMDKILKALRNGQYEDDNIFDSLELYFKQLQQLVIDLNNRDKVITIEPKRHAAPMADEIEIIKQFCKTA